MKRKDRLTPSVTRFPPCCLVEVAWEVCNQVGGIYTVIRSKAPAMAAHASGEYCMVGPYVHPGVQAELEPLHDSQDVFGQAASALRRRGYDVQYARWLITGKPHVVLLNPDVFEPQALNVVKYLLWKNHQIPLDNSHPLIDRVIAFSHLVKLFLDELLKLLPQHHPLLVHFHEWMAGLPILDIALEQMPVKTIFTTHATQLGRHLAIHSPAFYAHLPFFKVDEEARKFSIEAEVAIEAACAQKANVLTTVSEVTARECKHLLRRKPDVVLPNGLNIERFEGLHEFQNLHVQYKEQIHRFVTSHFFQSYSFDLNRTLYFFTSGRYEFRNKGFDLTLEALYRLNRKLKMEKSDVTIVMFFITKRDYHTVRPEVLQSKAMVEELSKTCEAIEQQVGQGLFSASTMRDDNHLPDLNSFVEEYWKLRYRRTIQAWKTGRNPHVSTHVLVNEDGDDIMRFVHEKQLLNHADDPVKIVYHPDFINTNNPLLSMDYNHFVRGCHLGVFPSYYEPWGYTPLECMANGVPSITSDLSGFGDYVQRNISNYNDYGLQVIERGKRSFDWSANQLAYTMHNFAMQSRRERVTQRNNVEVNASIFDWQHLIRHYTEAYQRAIAHTHTST